jgi:hypothetical protein
VSNDQHNPNPIAPSEPLSQTFFTVEICGGSPDLNNLACRIIELGIESAIACVEVQMMNRHKVPKLILHRPGTVQS